jgi:hypothetical protein
MVACSDNSLSLDMLDLVKLTMGIARVEERLQMVMMGFGSSAVIGGDAKARAKGNNPSLLSQAQLPNHMSWIVTMWHFGIDSLNGYSGEMFGIPWSEGCSYSVLIQEYKKTKKLK